MSENRRVSAFGDMEPKDTSRYLRETKRRCPTCGKSNMFVKVKDESTYTLECPNCDLVEHLPLGFEGPPAPRPMNTLNEQPAPTPAPAPVKTAKKAPKKKPVKKAKKR